MKTSFIVLTYNRSDALLAVLTSLAKQCEPYDEVLVADDGSNPHQVALLRQFCPAFKCPVRHIWHADIGFTAAAARNLGAYHSAGDYLVFLDGDCVPGPSFVKAHLQLAQINCFVNGSRVLLSKRLTTELIDGKADVSIKSLTFWLLARLKGDSNKLLHLVGWPSSLFRVKQGFSWKGIRSCNLAIWRSDFLAVNGFDETFEGWGHEDADLVLRLANFGVNRKNGFWATEVYHLWHHEHARFSESANKQKVFERMQTQQVIAVKGVTQIERDASGQVTRLH